MDSVFVHNMAGRGNVGDDFILYSIVKQLEKEYKNIFFSNGYYKIIESKLLKEELSNIIYTSILSIRLFYNIYRSDLIIIGGGQIFQDFKNPFFSGLGSSFIVALIARLFRKKIILYSIGSHILKNKISLLCLKFILKSAEKIYPRDIYTQTFLSTIVNKEFILTYDSVFGLSEYFDHDNKQERGKILVSTTEENYNLISKILEVNNIKDITYIIMDARYDYSDTRNTIDFNKISIKEIFAFLHQTKILISDRMHLCILSYIANVPYIYPLERDEKKIQYLSEILNLKKINDFDKTIDQTHRNNHKKLVPSTL